MRSHERAAAEQRFLAETSAPAASEAPTSTALQPLYALEEEDEPASLLQRLIAEVQLVSSLALPSTPIALPPADASFSPPSSPTSAANAGPPLTAGQTERALTLLQPKSDLRVQLRNYEPLAEQLNAADHCLPRELRCSHLTQCADHVDFIAPAENMKRFFRLLHDESAISLAVHRVGDTLVLEGLEADPWRAETAAGGAPASARSPNNARSSAPAPADEAGEQVELGPLQVQRKALDSRFLLYSLGAEGAAGGGRGGNGGSGGGGGAVSGGDSDSDSDSECGEWAPPREPPRGFSRVLRWQLDDISLLLGSDTVVFRSPTDASAKHSLDSSHSSASWAAPSFPASRRESNPTR